MLLYYDAKRLTCQNSKVDVPIGSNGYALWECTDSVFVPKMT